MAQGDKGRRALALGIGVVLLGISGVLRALDNDGETTAYAIGSAVGAVAAGLTLGALVRWAWVRLRTSSSGPALDPPWWLLASGVIGLVIGLSIAGRDAKESEESLPTTLSAVQPGGETCPAPQLETLGSGLVAKEPDAATEEKLRRGDPPGLGTIEYTLLERDGTLAALLGTLSVDPAVVESEGGSSQAETDALGGARDSAINQGYEVSDLTAGGHPVIAYGLPTGEFQVTGFIGCNVLYAFAADQEAARLALEAVIVAQPVT